MKEKVITIKPKGISQKTMVESFIRVKSNEDGLETLWC